MSLTRKLLTPSTHGLPQQSQVPTANKLLEVYLSLSALSRTSPTVFYSAQTYVSIHTIATNRRYCYNPLSYERVWQIHPTQQTNTPALYKLRTGAESSPQE